MARPTKERPTSVRGRQDIHLWIDAELRRRARILAAQRDQTLTEVIEQALREYLERHATE